MMKILLNLVFTIALFIISCSEVHAQLINKKVVGNGNVVSKVITTGDYDSILTVGSMDVHLEKGTEGKITVTTDDNLQEYIIVEVKYNNLVLRTKKKTTLKTKKGIHIVVPFKDISQLSLIGSGDVDTKDTIKSNEFEVSLTGSGDLNLDINVGELDAKITGSGDMQLSGDVKDFELKISGSGDFNGSSLHSENTQVYVSGSGDATVTAKDHLKARVNGSGNIDYSGNPKSKDTKVSGSGTIKAH